MSRACLLTLAGWALFFAFPASAAAPPPVRGLAAPGFDVTTWTSDDGLPTDAVNALAQTPDGYLWIGTNAGLARFDGVRFTVFDRRTTPALTSDQCGPLLVGRDGTLWIGVMGGGLARYAGGAFTVYGRAEGSTFEYITTMYEDRRGQLWVGGDDGVHLWDGARFRTIGPESGVRLDRSFPIGEDADGRVWFESTDGRFAWFRDGSFHDGGDGAELVPSAIPRPFRVFSLPDGSLWLTPPSPAALVRYAAGRATSVDLRLAPALDGVGRMAIDRAGDVWAGTRASGMRVIRGDRVTPIGTAEGLPSGPIAAVLVDREGDVWAGTGGGLARVKRRAFAVLEGAGGLALERTWAVYEDRRGDVWFGTDVMLWRLHDGTFARYGTKEGMPTAGVTSFAEDGAGTLWIGTNGGLMRMEGDRLVSYGPIGGAATPNVRALFADRKGRLWVGLTTGAAMIENGRATTFTAAGGLAGDWVRFIHEDAAGDIWFATTSGLSRLHDGALVSFHVGDGLADDRVLAIHEDPPGTLWLGTYRGGLSRFKDGRFATISTRQGLHDDTILRILEDDRGYLWMSTPRGVFRVGRQALDAVADGRASWVNSIAYDKTDGLPTADCGGGTQPAGWRARDGRLWFPTGRGVAVVDPAAVAVNATPPPVHVEEVLYDRIHPGGPTSATLPPGSKTVEFHYTATALSEPDRARFRYRLDPFDPDWVDAGSRRVAYYTALRPGRYRFRVLAANESGVWNETGAGYDLRVQPYFYETPAFFATMAGALALLAWGAYRLRVRQIEARYAAVLSERGRIARELHDTIAQGFTGVSMQLEAVSAKLGDAPEDVRDNLDRARLLVRSSLNDARRSVRALRPHLLESRDLAASLRTVAAQLTAGTKVAATVDAHGLRRRLRPEVEDALFRAGQEAMTNAIRHGGCTTLRIALRVAKGMATLAVEDDGAGFDTAEAKDGSGLAGMKERVAKLGGEVRVASALGRGTRVDVTVPA